MENGSCSHSRAHSRILWCRAPLPGSGCAQSSHPGRNLGMIPPEPFFPVSRAPHPKQTQGSGEKRGLPDFPKGTSQRGGLTPPTREKRPDHIPEHPKPWDCVSAPSPGRGLRSQGKIRAENSCPPRPGLFPVQLFHEIPRSKVRIGVFLAAPRIPRRERGHQTCSGVLGIPSSLPRGSQPSPVLGLGKIPPSLDAIPERIPGVSRALLPAERDLLGFIAPPEVKLGQELFQEGIPGASCRCGKGWSGFPASSEENPGWSCLLMVPPQRTWGTWKNRDIGRVGIAPGKDTESRSQIPQRGRASLRTGAGRNPGALERVNPIQVSPFQAELIPSRPQPPNPAGKAPCAAKSDLSRGAARPERLQCHLSEPGPPPGMWDRVTGEEPPLELAAAPGPPHSS